MSALYTAVSAIGQTVSLGFALFLAVGGSFGYYKQASMPSLIGGLGCGFLLALASLISPRSAASRVSVLLITAFVSGFFGVRFMQTGKLMPAGLGAGAGASVALLNFALLLGGVREVAKDKKDQ